MFKTCKNCTTDRHPGCHDHCERYKKEKAEFEARKAATAVDKSLTQYACYNAAKISDAAAKKRKERRGITKMTGGK